MRQKTYVAISIYFILTMSNLAYARRLFINGVEASNIRQVDLKRVDMQIQPNGDIYITAPHYQMTTTDQFVPLHEYMLAKPNANLPVPNEQNNDLGVPSHQAPGPLPRGHDKNSPITSTNPELIPKSTD